MKTAVTPGFRPLTGIYEPSAVLQLHDGRFLVVEDEKEHPFSLFTLRPDGSVSHMPLSCDGVADKACRKLDDLEGLTAAPSGWIYAITSHSRDGKGEQKKSRDKLIRFRIDGDRVAELAVYSHLKDALMAAHPLLETAARVRDVKGDGGLNIEALEFDPVACQLLIGMRSPLLDGRAIIARVENIVQIFDSDAAPRIGSTLVTLDLGGQGIRALSLIPALGGYLVISGPVAREQIQFQLWFWDGQQGSMARRSSVPGLPGFEHAEGITPVVLNGRQYLVIVSDDGSREENRYARFLLVEAEQIRIDG